MFFFFLKCLPFSQTVSKDDIPDGSNKPAGAKVQLCLHVILSVLHINICVEQIHSQVAIVTVRVTKLTWFMVAVWLGLGNGHGLG